MEIYVLEAGSDVLYVGPGNGLIWAIRARAAELQEAGLITWDDYHAVLLTGLNPLRHGGSFDQWHEQTILARVRREDLF